MKFRSRRKANLLRARRRRPVPVNPGRREFLKNGMAGLIFVSTAAPRLNSDDDVEVVSRDIGVPSLSGGLDGMRAVVMSDIHCGPYMDGATIRRYVDRINALDPDIVLLPGDFVNSRTEECDAVCEALRRIRSRHGVYGCLGNHDFYADGDFVASELGHAGVRVLRNEHAIIETAGGRFALAGIDDVRRGHPFDMMLTHALLDLPRSTPTVLLCHKPYYLDEAADWGIGMMLSGHTHGGQVVLARFADVVLTPAALVSRYVEGFYRRDNTRLYVTRGIGTVGIPVRINCPPEITVLTFRTA